MAKSNNPGNFNLFMLIVLWALGVLCFIYVSIVSLFVFHGDIDVDSAAWLGSAWIMGGLGLLFLIAAVGMTCVLAVLHLRSVRNASADTAESLRRLMSSHTSSEALLTQICENLLLSDSIKSVAFREKDREVMAEAVRQDMRAEQWESAGTLINELEERFGCKQLADELRQEMASLKNATKQEKIDAAVAHVRKLWMIHRYDEALKEAASLARLHPKEPDILALPEETEKHRHLHKKELLDRLNKAVEAKDIDQGVEVLKLLDDFLTATEAAALKESARDVFRAKLQKLGVEFSLFVTERKWDKALKVGKQITDEYPNSRMAQEVREKMDILQQRAHQPA
ncbi:MAG: hypothetical protein JW936_00020 [Sedimentisphaerales bacterium]|nr:hypothetical protein [Sedimentisphaerales bacterium]